MKRLLLRAFATLLILLTAAPRALSQDSAILALTGASAIEELDESEYERLSALKDRPVPINLAPPRELLSSGLFTRFQAASIADYRSRDGDILSLTELGLIDGFSPELAKALSPFIDLTPSASAVSGPRQSKHEAITRLSAKNGSPGYDAKYRFTGKSGLTLSLTARKSAAASKDSVLKISPDTWSFCAEERSRSGRGKILIGDFNARFGQGLALWSGFSMSGFGGSASFDRHPSYLSPSWSLSPAGPVRGIGGDYILGRWQLSSALIFNGLRSRMESGKSSIEPVAALNLSRLGSRSELGATLLLSTGANSGQISRAKVSADLRWTPGKTGFFGEFAWDMIHNAPGAVAGMIWSPAWQKKVSLAARHYGSGFDSSLTGGIRSGSKCSDESGIALGLTLPRLEMSADFARYPKRETTLTRIICRIPLEFSHFSLTPRTSFRWQNAQLRQEYRLDSRLTISDWTVSGRADLVHCEKTSWHGSFEAGYKSGNASLYLRSGIFKADLWADRIYVYQRDLPGCFNVPALYGRGFIHSLDASLKRKRHSFALHASLTRYVGDKAPRSEFKIQYSLKL